MPDVVISFVDGEVLHAATPELTFDLPIIEAEMRGVDANTDEALFPLAAIRLLLVGDVEPAPEAADLETWDRAVFHFNDGETLRVHMAPDALLGRHGGLWRVVEPGSDEMRTLGIPYSALKGIYRVRQWDSRSPADRRAGDPDARADQLTRILAERDERAGAEPRRQPQPLMRRVRRTQRRPPAPTPEEDTTT